MAELTVYNADGDSFVFDNNLNKKAVKITGGAGSNDKVYRFKKIILDLEAMTYDAHFSVKDVSPDESYESMPLSTRGVSGELDPSWINTPNINVRKLKADAINKLFVAESWTPGEPINLSDFSVVVEYASAP